MSLQFVMGRAGSGKSTYLLNRIRTKLQEDPAGHPIIYLVPDQMTFQAEYDLIRTPQLKGLIRAQVFSFTRLAYRVFQETGGMTLSHLDQTALRLLLRKIMEYRKTDLRIFHRSMEQQGFYENLEKMITECKQYCVSAEELQSKREELEENGLVRSPILLDKLHDLHLVYNDLEEALVSKYADPTDHLRLLTDKVPFSSMIQQAEILVDGFHQFTTQELLVLQALIKHSDRVEVAITMDREYADVLPNDLDLFYPTAVTYQKIRTLAESVDVPIEESIWLSGSSPRFESEPSLAHLETYFAKRPALAYRGDSSVSLAAAVNRRAEVEGVARQIVKLVREQDYRWRDMAIFVRDMNLYHDLLGTVFEDHGIPLFADQKRSMLHHPLIEFVRSSLDVILNNWRHEAVFRCVKTDLLFPVQSANEVRILRIESDQLENYVLSKGFNGASRWLQKEPWQVEQPSLLDTDEVRKTERDREIQDRFHRLRMMVVQPISELQQQVGKQNTIQEMCKELYYFLERLNIPHKLEGWRDIALKSGYNQLSREHHQAWRAMVQLLDQMVEMMGDEMVSLELFAKLLETGFENMHFAVVPPSIDQVLVGNLERSRFSSVKCGFILGCNDGIIPPRMKKEQLISDIERDALITLGIELAPGSRQQITIEQFFIYTAMCNASDRLWLSYALADEEGKSLSPSMLVNQVKQLFPDIEEELLLNDPFELEPKKQLEYLTQPAQTLSYLATGLRYGQEGQPIAEFWWDVYNWFCQSNDWEQKGQVTLSSLLYENIAQPLHRETTEALYGTHIKTSISRLERFNACSFSQFLSHGLRLKERQVFRLEAPDIGQLFHAALKWVDDWLREQQRHWDSLTKEDCHQLANSAIEVLASRLQSEILFSSNRFHYIKVKLERVVERTVSILSEHAKRSDFTPIGLELEFGRNAQLPPLIFSLENGVTLEIIGRIDRVDQSVGQSGKLLRIIDYKSSSKSVSLAEIYHGLSLQMLAYLDVVITHSEEWLGSQALPAGVLYFHVHNPLLSKKATPSQEQLEQEIYKQFKMKGIVLADKETVQLMDTSLESKHSEIIPVALKTDGQFYSTSSIATKEDFDHLRKYVRDQMKSFGTRLMDGDISIDPYQLGNKTACTFCDYKPVCQFDQNLNENSFRLLPHLGKETAMDKIRRSVSGSGSNYYIEGGEGNA